MTTSWSGRLPAQRPRAVIFDMDGLMFDTERLDLTIWRTVATSRGFAYPDELHHALVGRSTTESEAILRERLGEAFPLASVKQETHERWSTHVAAHGAPVKRGLDELLEWLERASIPKAVATSTVRAKALTCLGARAARFQALACGDEVPRGKPAPDVYLLAAARLGVAPSAALALEDSPPGYAAATAAGMTVVLIPDLIRPAVPPPFTCGSLEDITLWLRSESNTESSHA